jgi:hypothetical protein
VLSDLQIKLEKYEAKAAQCQRLAQEAADGPVRALYEELASYYGELATDFRQVIARRPLHRWQPNDTPATRAMTSYASR